MEKLCTLLTQHWSCVKRIRSSYLAIFAPERVQTVVARNSMVEFFILNVERAGFQIYTNVLLNQIRNFYINVVCVPYRLLRDCHATQIWVTQYKQP